MTEFLVKWIGDTLAYILIISFVISSLVGAVYLLVGMVMGIIWLVTHVGWVMTAGIVMIIMCSILGFFSARHDLASK